MKEKPTPKEGQIWRHTDDNDCYILTMPVFNLYSLISIYDGSRWIELTKTQEKAFGKDSYQSEKWEFVCDGDALKPALNALRQS